MHYIFCFSVAIHHVPNCTIYANEEKRNDDDGRLFLPSSFSISTNNNRSFTEPDGPGTVIAEGKPTVATATTTATMAFVFIAQFRSRVFITYSWNSHPTSSAPVPCLLVIAA